MFSLWIVGWRCLISTGRRKYLNGLGLLSCNFSGLVSKDESELKEFNDYLNNLKNHEKSGVPKGAGTDSQDGFDLGRMKRLMKSLGNPQSKYKAIHIAGTKGKGSTAAFLSNILRAQGYSVGCYTSPHIKTIRERLRVGKLDDPVSPQAMNSSFQRIKVALDQAVQLEQGHLSHFEVLTAVAFNLFAEENVDIAVIEAGLGGARDATNIISSSDLAASVITTISEEHLAALGGSLENIAVAKSGIIKHGCPVSTGWRISDGSIRTGLESTQLLGRSQFLTPAEIEALGLPGATILLDGAHTKESAKALADMIQITYPDKKIIFVVAMASDKDHQAFARELLAVKQVEAIFLTEVGIAGDWYRTASLSLLRDRWVQASNELGIKLSEYGVREYNELLRNQSGKSADQLQDRTLLFSSGSVLESMRIGDKILKSKGTDHPGLFVVTGSLHIVSSVLSSI